MKNYLFSIRKLAGYLGLFAMLFCFSSSSRAQTGTLLAGWHFNNYNGETVVPSDYGTGTIYLDGTQGSSAWTALTNFGGDNGNTSGFPTSPGAGASLSLVGTANNGKSLVFKFSMSGYTDLNVTFVTRGTATGYSSGTWAYSTDGTVWTALPDNTATQATSYSLKTLATITGLNNAANAYLRYTLSGATTASGNNRVDNVQLRATPSALMITLGNVSATNKGNSNQVEWNSVTEDKGDLFEIERSNNGTTFEKIATLPASGTPGHYNYNDKQPYAGINYYRLILLNNDGTRVVSKVVSALVKENNFEINVYPNPVINELSVRIKEVTITNARISVIDVTGKILETKILSTASETVTFDMSKYPAGLYLLNYNDGNNQKVIKINKSK
ncbi:T9SS type A sorting domain-containing protein [Taibaiella lutea]|uniref:T9SS type A sorting domain-containing protein n=1 Tax=Taibaiella lutea TaxID=2608001 RepID=A0A5M6CHL6_9BACT|nr:T9SS type A sorting domain-containing protein [Taibaiella lutea]KAA5534476.1 T9SS type A sorting domain-containing protein [Taibaiella lutea]